MVIHCLSSCSGIAMLTPEMVHRGHAEAVLDQRHQVVLAAYAAHPERFINGPPKIAALPQAVWINPPQPARDPRNENENSHCKSAVPVSFGADFILPESRL